jgi:hypothetical protein
MSVEFDAFALSAGDLYRAVGGTPAQHGVGPLLLEPHESRRHHEGWREDVRQRMAPVDEKQPLFLEAYLAGRWFHGAHRDRIVAMAPMAKGQPASFIEVLLDRAINWPGPKNTTAQGTLFEAAAGLSLSATPGFTVYSCRSNKDEQIDLVVRYEPDGVAPPCLPLGYGIVECKAEEGPVNSPTLREFGAKCQFHRVQFGILIARSGIKGAKTVFTDLTAAELVRRRFLGEGLTILVLELDHLRGGCDRELRGLHDALFEDYQNLVFGQIIGDA